MAAITAVKLATNDIVLFTATAATCTAGTNTWLDVSTMDGSKAILMVHKVGGKAGTIVVTDGANFTAGAVGNVSQLTTDGTGDYILGPFETSRMKDSNGRINVIKSTVDTDVFTARAILLP